MANVLNDLSGVVKAITEFGELLTGILKDLTSWRKDKRNKIAAMLDHVAKDVLKIADGLKKREVKYETFGEINTYSKQLPDLIKSVYKADVADELGEALKRVYLSKETCAELMRTDSASDLARKVEELAATMESSAGTIKATATALRGV